MKYPCRISFDSEDQSWDSEIQILDYILETFECRINGRGSSYHAVIGRYMNGCFICIPALGICSDLADYSDTFWNTEKLERFLPPVDAVTVANGISTLKHIRDDLGWYNPFQDQ